MIESARVLLNAHTVLEAVSTDLYGTRVEQLSDCYLFAVVAVAAAASSINILRRNIIFNCVHATNETYYAEGAHAPTESTASQ